MIDLGKDITAPEMYPSMNGEDKVNKKKQIIYPHVNMPLAIIGENVPEVGQSVTLTLKGTIKSIIQTEHCEEVGIEVSEGEVSGVKKDDKTLLG